jgi:hypothetical protein
MTTEQTCFYYLRRLTSYCPHPTPLSRIDYRYLDKHKHPFKGRPLCQAGATQNSTGLPQKEGFAYPLRGSPSNYIPNLVWHSVMAEHNGSCCMLLLMPSSWEAAAPSGWVGPLEACRARLHQPHACSLECQNLHTVVQSPLISPLVWCHREIEMPPNHSSVLRVLITSTAV